MNAVATADHFQFDETFPADLAQRIVAVGTPMSSDVPQRFKVSSRADRDVVAALNYLFIKAAEQQYSDIHFESDQRGVVVRMRQFGDMAETVVLVADCDNDINRILRARANVPENDDVAPKDGTFFFRAETRVVDVRLSFLTTRSGRSIVCRILDQSNASRPFSSIPMNEQQRGVFRAALFANEGLVLCVGPTGSGKTSTLYSCMKERNVPTIKMLSIEDPVEYFLPGVQQVNVQDPLRSFAKAVRSALRQDIDVALVGEIRDRDTAHAATDISNTGHLILSTLHSNDALSAITRLTDSFGIDPFALASALRLVVAQRLLRKLCAECKVDRQMHQHEVDALTARGYARTLQGSTEPARSASVHEVNRVGCDACGYRGYSGVRPILELLNGDRAMRQAIEGGGLAALRQAADGQSTYRKLNHAAIDAAFDDGDVDITEAIACAAAV